MPATARRSPGVIAREAAQYQFLDFCDASRFSREQFQRRRATKAQTASTTPKGRAPP